MAIVASRPLSLWFSNGAGPLQAQSIEQGSPLERTVYSLLILAGVLILSRRKKRFAISELISANKALALLLGYYALAILWSDYPFVSFKRYIKLLGVLVMILVILTDVDPILALRTAARRCGFILLPLSLLLAKYFDAGVSYDTWTGMRMIVGVASTKNMLGQLCLVFGLFFIWDIILYWKDNSFKHHRLVLIINVFMLFSAIHLLIQANSQTSFVCLILGCAILFATRYDFVQKRIGLYILIATLTFLVLNSITDLIPAIIHSLGRNTTLTDRTIIWEGLLPMAKANLWFGTGYEDFWMGDRLPKVWAFAGHINEAHNGYLEIVLNTGLVGLSLFSLFIVSTYRRCREMIRSNPEYGRFAMAYFFTMLLYNFTEAGFRGLSIMFFVFLMIGLKLPEASNALAGYGDRERAPVLKTDCA